MISTILQNFNARPVLENQKSLNSNQQTTMIPGSVILRLGLLILGARQLNCPKQLPNDVALGADLPLGSRGTFEVDESSKIVTVQQYQFNYWALGWKPVNGTFSFGKNYSAALYNKALQQKKD